MSVRPRACGVLPLRPALFPFLVLAVGLLVPARAAETVTRPFRGITLITRTDTTPRGVRSNVVRVDLTAPGVSFKLSPPGGRRDTVRQTTLDFLRLEKAQVAINVHFFVPYPSDEPDADVVGLASSLGKAYSPFERQPVGPAYPDQSYAILPYAPALNIDAANRVSLVRSDPAQPARPLLPPGVTLWNAFAGSAQIVREGVKTLPRYSGPPDGLTPAREYAETNSWYALRRARTAVGVTADGKTLVLFTVDQGAGSEGMTVVEVAERLIEAHAVATALNLDGGGSTTLALQDPVTQQGRLVNVPSDGAPGRAVGSNLAVFAAPLTPEPPRTPAAPAAR
jgi:hypothetical protein